MDRLRGTSVRSRLVKIKDNYREKLIKDIRICHDTRKRSDWRIEKHIVENYYKRSPYWTSLRVELIRKNIPKTTIIGIHRMNNKYNIEYIVQTERTPGDIRTRTVTIKQRGKIVKKFETKHLTTKQRNQLYRVIGGIQERLKEKKFDELLIPKNSLKGGRIQSILLEDLRNPKETISYILNKENTNKQFELVYQYYKENV